MDLHGNSVESWEFEDVWFIDGSTSEGEYAGDWGATFEPSDADHVAFGVTTTGGNHIELGFGGIQPNLDTNGYWPYSNNGSDGSENNPDPDFYDLLTNTNYGSHGQLAQYLNTATIFRWTDDPTDGTGQIFVVSDTADYNLVRHETKPEDGYANNLHAKAAKGLSSSIIYNYIQYATSTFFRPDNFSKNFKLKFDDYVNPGASIEWNPYTTGPIANGIILELTEASSGGMLASENSVTVTSLNVADVSAGAHGNFTVREGMVWDDGTPGGTDGGVISKIDIASKKLYFKHYDPTKPTSDFASGIADGATFRVYQYGMNGISRNSAKNINFFNNAKGFNDQYIGVDAVGYEIEILEPEAVEALFPRFPAIFETEPKENEDLDIYYEITDNIPTNLNTNTIASILPINAIVDIDAADGSVGVNGYMAGALSLIHI